MREPQRFEQPPAAAAPAPRVSAREAVTTVDPDGTIIGWSDGAAALYGWSSEEAVGHNVTLIALENDVLQQMLVARVMAGETLPPTEVHRRTRDGRIIDVELTLSPVVGPDGNVVAATAVHRDVTDRIDLRIPEVGLWAPVADGLVDAVVILAPVYANSTVADFRYIYANPAAGALAGAEPGSLVGMLMLGANPPPNQVDVFNEYRKVLFSGEPYSAEVPSSRLDGDSPVPQIAWLSVHASRLDGGLLVVSHDNTAPHLATEVLEFLALTDPVTGLPNRRLAVDRGTQELARATRTSGELAVFFIDLDGFKEINDEYGHPTGDAVLRATGERLANEVRDVDTVARWGGDEFVVLCCTDGRREQVDWVAQRLQAAVRRPIPTELGEVTVGASIGIATSTGGPDAPSVDELVRRADLAMYEAKSRSGDRWVRYEDLTDSGGRLRPTVAARRRSARHR